MAAGFSELSTASPFLAHSERVPIIDPAIIAEIKRLELRTKRIVSSDLIGRFRSSFRGSGLTFSDLREYQPGDEVKSIHWKATARSDKVYVKSYLEERSLQVLLAVDVSRSTDFGAPKRKHQRALEFATLISVLCSRSGDAVGLAMFSGEVEEFLAPSRQRSQLSRLVLKLLEKKPIAKHTSIAPCLKHFMTHLRRRSVIFIISDFYSDPFDEDLQALAFRHDVILVHLSEPDEKIGGLVDCGIVEVTDAESGERFVIDTSSAKALQVIQALESKRIEGLEALARRCGADYVRITESNVKPLAELMNRRARRFGR